MDQFLHIGLAMSVVRLHDQDQVPIGFQGPSQFHLTELALGDAFRQKDQDIATEGHAVAHAPDRWVLETKMRKTRKTIETGKETEEQSS